MTRKKNKPFISAPGPYEAIVVGHMDGSYSGILKVELLSKTRAGNEPERTGQLLDAKYMSPFYGVTPQGATTGLSGYKNTQKSYGMWMIPPDVGTKVIVILIEGNYSQGYWIGCVQDAYMNFMLPGYAATKQVESVTEDATGQVAKKVPVAEYNKYRETGTGRNPTKFLKPPHSDLIKQLVEQGLLDDDVRGTTSSSARREVPSAVFGISTPGPIDKRNGSPTAGTGDESIDKNTFKAQKFVSRLGGSSFVMDDGDDKLLRKGPASTSPPEYENLEALEEGQRHTADVELPANELVRIRTRTGHQILLHNTEDLIYIGNARGTSWIELTSNGKIDIYAQDSISVHSANDINFSADRDINFNAGENVNMMVGKQVRTTAGESINNVAGTNYNTTAGQGISEIAGTDIANYANKKASYQSVGEFTVNSGRHVGISSGGFLGLDSNQMLNIYSGGDTNFITGQKLSLRASNDTNIRLGNVYAETGDFHLGVGEYSSISGEGVINIGCKEFYVNTDTRTEINSDGNFYSLVGRTYNVRAGADIKIQSEYGDIGLRAENNLRLFAKERNIEVFAAENLVQESGVDTTIVANKAVSILSKSEETPFTIESKHNLDITTAKKTILSSTESISISSEEDVKTQAGKSFSVSAGEKAVIRADDEVGIGSGGDINVGASGVISLKGSDTKVQPSGPVSVPSTLSTDEAASATDGALISIAENQVERLVSYVKWHRYDKPYQPRVVINETFAPPAFPAQPTPALYADRVARVPMHEPWNQHENLNPLEFTPDKTRAGSEQSDVFRVEMPDTFATFPVTQDSLGTLSVSPRLKITEDNYFSKIEFTKPSGGDISSFTDVASRMGISEPLALAVIAVLTSQYGEFSHTLAETVPSVDGPEQEVADLVRKRYHNMIDKSDEQVLSAVKGNFFYEVYGHATDYGKAIGNYLPADADSFKGQGYYLGIVGRRMWTKIQLANHYAFGQPFSADAPPTDQVLLQYCLARYVEKFYKDHGRGTLGNVRIMLFGSQDYDLAHLRDQWVYRETFGD